MRGTLLKKTTKGVKMKTVRIQKRPRKHLYMQFSSETGNSKGYIFTIVQCQNGN